MTQHACACVCVLHIPAATKHVKPAIMHVLLHGRLTLTATYAGMLEARIACSICTCSHEKASMHQSDIKRLLYRGGVL